MAAFGGGRFQVFLGNEDEPGFARGSFPNILSISILRSASDSQPFRFFHHGWAVALSLAVSSTGSWPMLPVPHMQIQLCFRMLEHDALSRRHHVHDHQLRPGPRMGTRILKPLVMEDCDLLQGAEAGEEVAESLAYRHARLTLGACAVKATEVPGERFQLRAREGEEEVAQVRWVEICSRKRHDQTFNLGSLSHELIIGQSPAVIYGVTAINACLLSMH